MLGNFGEISCFHGGRKKYLVEFSTDRNFHLFPGNFVEISAKDEELASDWLFYWKFPEITVEISLEILKFPPEKNQFGEAKKKL